MVEQNKTQFADVRVLAFPASPLASASEAAPAADTLSLSKKGCSLAP